MTSLFRTAPQAHSSGVFFLILCRLRILCNAAFCQFCHHIDLLQQALDFCINARAVRQRGLHQAAVLKDAVLNRLLKFRRINGENPDKIGVFFGYIFFVASLCLWWTRRDSNP